MFATLTGGHPSLPVIYAYKQPISPENQEPFRQDFERNPLGDNDVKKQLT